MTELAENIYKWPVGRKSDEEYLADIGEMFSKQDQPITKMPDDGSVLRISGFYGRRRVYVYVGRWNDFYYVVRAFKGAKLTEKYARIRKRPLIKDIPSLLKVFGEHHAYWRAETDKIVQERNKRWYALGVPRVDKEIEAAFKLANGGWIIIQKYFLTALPAKWAILLAVVIWTKEGRVVEKVPYDLVPPEVACSTSEYGDLFHTVLAGL